MESVKKFLNILVMVYLLIAFLFLLRILSVSKFVALFDLAHDAAFYNRLLWVGAVLLLAELLVENMYIATLKRSLERERRQVSQLKSQYYDQQMAFKTQRYDQQMKTPAAPPVPDPVPANPATVPPSSSHYTGSAKAPEQGPIITPAPMPPTLPPQENPNLPPTDHRPFA
ncbi:hypothetical protein [Rufibacter sp. XAAS-G3-1]|uniref:hypothetical protein n=1 Tax=Rufibacter sp. XAAS-G3-1 TaxID=2729134 RepID=UPI0015E7063A|nr:hypothetical protein [Rufibacter sp. XAAS-G3-1]